MIVPTLCVGMHLVTLCVTLDAERPGRHSHAERGNDQRMGAARGRWSMHDGVGRQMAEAFGQAQPLDRVFAEQ
ncbi:hypothetical protein EGJ53_17810 [Pseudomonas fluorescens]|nr:hypothetical protein EGJ53_17810 [Pseudomonas fluorescens]